MNDEPIHIQDDEEMALSPPRTPPPTPAGPPNKKARLPPKRMMTTDASGSKVSLMEIWSLLLTALKIHPQWSLNTLSTIWFAKSMSHSSNEHYFSEAWDRVCDFLTLCRDQSHNGLPKNWQSQFTTIANQRLCTLFCTKEQMNLLTSSLRKCFQELETVCLPSNQSTSSSSFYTTKTPDQTTSTSTSSTIVSQAIECVDAPGSSASSRQEERLPNLNTATTIHLPSTSDTWSMLQTIRSKIQDTVSTLSSDAIDGTYYVQIKLSPYSEASRVAKSQIWTTSTRQAEFVLHDKHHAAEIRHLHQMLQMAEKVVSTTVLA